MRPFAARCSIRDRAPVVAVARLLFSAARRTLPRRRSSAAPNWWSARATPRPAVNAVARLTSKTPYCCSWISASVAQRRRSRSVSGGTYRAVNGPRYQPKVARPDSVRHEIGR